MTSRDDFKTGAPANPGPLRAFLRRRGRRNGYRRHPVAGRAFVTGKAGLVACILCAKGAGQVSEDGRVTPLDPCPRGADGHVLRAEESSEFPTASLDADGQGVPRARSGHAAHLAVIEAGGPLSRATPAGIVAAHDAGSAMDPLRVEGRRVALWHQAPRWR